jgi:hypothetical protein
MEKEIQEPQTAVPAAPEKMMGHTATPKVVDGMYSSAPFARGFVGASRHGLPSKVSTTQAQDESE